VISIDGVPRHLSRPEEVKCSPLSASFKTRKAADEKAPQLLLVEPTSTQELLQ
jgi:hypothetical protein